MGVAMSNLALWPLYREAGRGRGRNELRMERLRRDMKNTEVLFFNEHSMQKAWTQASASDIIHLAGEDPVNGRGRQRQSLPRQPPFEAAADSLLFSCCCIHPPSFALSLFLWLTRSPSLTHSVPLVAIQAWAVFAAHEALDLPVSVLLCSAAHSRMGHSTTQISGKNTCR